MNMTTDDFMSSIDGHRFTDTDGNSILVMFENLHSLAIDFCSNKLEMVSENESIPLVEYTIIATVK